MRLLSSCHSLLLCPLLLVTLLAHTQQEGQTTPQPRRITPQPRQDTLHRRQDTLLLHFAFDKYDIQPAEAAQAAQAARLFHDSTILAKNIDSVLITGYTDKTGAVAYNRQLSRQRAAAAGHWLQTQLRANSLSLTPRPPSPTPRPLSPSPKTPSRSPHTLSPIPHTPARSLHAPAVSARDALTWRLVPGGIAPTPERTDSDNRRAEIIIVYHVAPPVAPRVAPPAAPRIAPPPPDAPPPADTATALNRDSTQPSVVISLQHINFIVDTPIPTDATQQILPGYVQTLRKYADRRMEIDGYCNSIVPLSGADDPLFKLSVKRAKFIYDYLVDAGFDPARLTYKGMGNASPINPDPVDREEMNANMRVEIKVY